MRIAKRLLLGAILPLTLGISLSPAIGSDVLQCVPYARELSGVRIHGDAWTWWDQARGRYERGSAPKPGAVLALANTGVMPLGHVAVVSHVIDERRILLRHANWSGPGLIERDVMAIDSSADNDWSQVRIWWGQSQQMGARDNPVDGFIYPERVSDRALLDPEESDRIVQPVIVAAAVRVMPSAPRLTIDPALLRGARDTAVSAGSRPRTLSMIIRDVERGAGLR